MECIRGNAVHEFGHALSFAEAVVCQTSDSHAPPGDQSWRSETDGTYTNMANCVGSPGFTSVDAFNVANLYGPERGLPLQVSGGFCIKPTNSMPNTTDNTGVLLKLDCKQTSVTNKFEFTPTGQLRHTSSGKCLQPRDNPAPNGGELMLTRDCASPATQFQAYGRQLLHVASDRCLQPGLVWTEMAQLILWGGCDQGVQFKPLIAHPDGSFWPAHVGGLRIMPQTLSGATPPDQTVAVLGDSLLTNSAGQLEKHVFAANGSISYRGKCLNPSSGGTNPPTATPLVYSSACGGPAQAFEVTLKGSLRHSASGLCVHPMGGAEKPALGTTLVLREGCDLERLRFGSVDTRIQFFYD